MRLSMWMLLDWLREFAPEPLIHDGTRTLRNVRLLSESREIARTTVYLQQNDPNTIMCMNGTDIIAVHSDDVDEILNALLDAFDHYNEWAGQMDDLIRSGCTLKELLELASRELRMRFMAADATYFIYEHSDYGGIPKNKAWQTIIESRSMELGIILEIDRRPHVRAADAGIYYVDIPEYKGSWPVANIFVNGTHQGWLIGDRDSGEYTQGELDLLDALKAKVEDWLRQNGGTSTRHEYTGVLSRLIEGEDVGIDEAQRALSVFGWRNTDELRVYAFREIENSGQPTLAIERFLRQLGSNTLMASADGNPALVVNQSLEDMQTLREDMERILALSGCVAGESPCFRDIMELSSCYRAACVAVSEAQAGILRFDDIKLPYALSLIREHAAADVRHAALDILRTYDEKHGTQLFETLASFVRNRGSYVDTYEELFIHRSTLTYRLERICVLTDIDFDNDATWEHLVLSFMLDRA